MLAEAPGSNSDLQDTYQAVLPVVYNHWGRPHPDAFCSVTRGVSHHEASTIRHWAIEALEDAVEHCTLAGACWSSDGSHEQGAFIELGRLQEKFAFFRNVEVILLFSTGIGRQFWHCLDKAHSFHHVALPLKNLREHIDEISVVVFVLKM